MNLAHKYYCWCVLLYSQVSFPSLNHSVYLVFGCYTFVAAPLPEFDTLRKKILELKLSLIVQVYAYGAEQSYYAISSCILEFFEV